MNHPLPAAAGKTRGRPRRCDPHHALDAAMRVFWATGYAGASVSQLCRSMRMPKASLYQRFGDKEGLFLAAIQHYAETRLSCIAVKLLPAKGLRDDLYAFYDAAITLATTDPATPGCLISCVLADAAGDNPRLRLELHARFTALERRLRDRLVAGRHEMTTGADPDVHALLLASVARGLMLRARAGASRDDLLAVARAAVDLLCAPPPT